MKFSVLSAMLLTAMLVTALPAAARDADPVRGKELHDASCIRCHAADTYTKAERRKKDLKQLQAMVEYCSQMVGAQWFEDDVADVTAYLNQTFYKFK
ncbi:MAG: hypothetical protein HQL82_00510 [Magnetococcales bacterium]|nr:hypothetical protein [Magnetococcales bacterium]